MTELKTSYEWCVDANIRIIDLFDSEENWYFTTPVSKVHFLDWLNDKNVKPNSMPRKTEMYLEYRMYGLVAYNISPIQAGIQYGHAVVEYQQNCRNDIQVERIYNKWASQDKTFIILNGGTTNETLGKSYGTLQQHRDNLKDNGVVIAEFKEPDLNDTLTAVVFLVDERVFDKEKYPDYVDIPYPWSNKRGYRPTNNEKEKWEVINQTNRDKWVEKIGGPTNDFLRTYLRTFRLANN